MFKFVLASTLCLALANESTGDADCLQSEGTSCVQGELSFLQKQIALQTDADATDDLPVLTLLGRSFYSKDPSASAAFMQRYFNGDVVDNPSGMVTSHGAVTAGAFLKSRTEAGDYTMLFARDVESDSKLDEFVETCELEFNDMTSPSKKNWSHWGDMHDGIADYVFNLHNAATDGMKFFHHGSVTRSMLEGTTYTFELRMANTSTTLDAAAFGSGSIEEALDDTCGFEIQSASDREYLVDHSWDLEEPCRVSPDVEMEHANAVGANNHLWWKSTFAVANAAKANTFAMDVLGATYEFCPFPYPPSATCTGALWLNVADEGDVKFQLHFVEFYEGSEHDEIVGIHAYHAEQAKALSQGCMSQSMYNNVAFNVATLDPFVDRLRKTSTPFLAMKTSSGRYALIFAFTGNEGIVIQLQSDVLTKAEALDSKAVSQACASLQH